MNNSGFSLINILVSIGISSMVTLTSFNMISGQKKSLREFRSQQAALGPFLSKLRNLINSDREFCEENFKGQNFQVDGSNPPVVDQLNLTPDEVFDGLSDINFESLELSNKNSNITGLGLPVNEFVTKALFTLNIKKTKVNFSLGAKVETDGINITGCEIWLNKKEVATAPAEQSPIPPSMVGSVTCSNEQLECSDNKRTAKLKGLIPGYYLVTVRIESSGELLNLQEYDFAPGNQIYGDFMDGKKPFHSFNSLYMIGAGHEIDDLENPEGKAATPDYITGAETIDIDSICAGSVQKEGKTIGDCLVVNLVSSKNSNGYLKTSQIIKVTPENGFQEGNIFFHAVHANLLRVTYERL